jgi:general secretion pathway protein D
MSHHGFRILVLLFVMLVHGPAWAEPVTLNLKDADVESLIGTISGITGKNFIVDPRVKGKVTVIASHPMDEEEIYQVFLSVLRVHGFAAVPSGSVIKIVPEANAKQDDIPMAGSAEGRLRDQAVTMVIPLQNVTAAQLVPVLRPLVPPQGHLAAYAPTNVLIISDRAANVERMRTIIERVDLESSEEVEVVRLEHASAGEVVRIIGTLLPPGGSPEAAMPVRVVADDRTNSVIMSGERAGRLRYRTLIAHLDTPVQAGGNTQVIYLRYAEATDLVAILQGVSASFAEAEGAEGGGGTPADRAKVDIQADESTNALIVTAPPDTLLSLQQVIRQLDIRRAQVLVEAVIADITYDRASELGVSWILDASNKSPGGVGIINLNDGLGQAGGILDPDFDALPRPGLPGGVTMAIGDLSGSVQFAAIIRALSSDGETNLLSTPTLVTLDNEEAEIVVGDNVPFVTGSFTNNNLSDAEGNVNPFQTIERQDVGLTLKIKPQINEGNSMKLEISQEVSSLRSALASRAVGATDITTSKRSITTTVQAESGQVIVLGGLVDDTTREGTSKVPGLGDLPILGGLFRYESTELAKRNLMVFIRPVILRDPQQAQFLSNRKYAYIREQQLIKRDQGLKRIPDANIAVLPTPEEIEQQQSLTPLDKPQEVVAEEVTSQKREYPSFSDKESQPEW